MQNEPQKLSMAKVEVQCDEDGNTFVCLGTMDKRKALKEIRSFAEHECGLDKEYLPKLDDLYLNPLWYGLNEYEGEWWYYWGNPPKENKYLGSCYRFDIN